MKRDWLPRPPPHHLLEACGLPAIQDQLHEEFKSVGERLLRRCKENGRLRKGDRVLDIDCRGGRFAQVLLDEPIASYVGISSNPEIVDWYAREVTRRDPRFQFLLSDVVETRSDVRSPFPDDSFDFVMADSVFKNVPPKVAASYLREISRVLAPGGRVVLDLYFAIGTTYLEPGFSFFNPKDFTRMVEEAGLRLEMTDIPFTGRAENWVVLTEGGAPEAPTTHTTKGG